MTGRRRSVEGSEAMLPEKKRVHDLGFVDLNDDSRWKAICRWEADQIPESGVVRIYRDYARERAALVADRERRLQQMHWRQQQQRSA